MLNIVNVLNILFLLLSGWLLTGAGRSPRGTTTTHEEGDQGDQGEGDQGDGGHPVTTSSWLMRF